jgi:hypothetical protein
VDAAHSSIGLMDWKRVIEGSNVKQDYDRLSDNRQVQQSPTGVLSWWTIVMDFG